MIVYQVKVVVAAEIEDQWLDWMKKTHVPDLLATGLVVSSQIYKSLDDVHTYFFHYQFHSLEDYRSYAREHAPHLQAHPLKVFGDKFTASRMLLQVV